MASNIKFKRSAVQNRVPTTAQLDLGELALNTYDGKLYTEINTGSAAVVEIGSKLSSLVVDGANGAGGGDVTFHGQTSGRDLLWDYSENSLRFSASAQIKMGENAQLLQLYNDGANTNFIRSSATNLRINSNIFRIRKLNDTDNFLNASGDQISLYYGGNIRISTTDDGADISGTGSLKLPVGTTAQRNSSPTSGDIRFNSSLGAFEGYSGAGWGELGGGGIGIGSTAVNPASGLVVNRIGVGFTDINVVGTGISVTGYGSTIVLDFNDFKPGSFNRSIHNYTATAGQTTFAGLSYDNSERQIAVYLNGARLSEATYTATSGTTVVLDVGASVGDEVEIINININSDVDRNVNTYTATAGQTTFTGLSYNSITELDVYLNGIRLATGDFTATTGNTVVLAVGASVNDIVDIVSTGDGVSFRSTADTSGDKFTLTNVGIGTDVTPDKLNVTGNVNIVGVLTATTLHGDGSNLTNTGSTLSEPSSGTQRLVTTSLTTGTMTSSGTGSELAFDYANNHLEFSDDTHAVFGTGGDMHIYHDGSASHIGEFGTGDLRFTTNGAKFDFQKNGGEVLARFHTDGAIELRHDNSIKFQTTSSGITVTGGVTADGFTLGDNENIQFGASNDLKIFHNGSHSYIADLGTGDLRITGSAVHIQNAAQSENMIKCFEGDRVELYHNNSKKFQTTSTGASVTGNLAVSGVLTYDDVTNVDSVGIITARNGINCTTDGVGKGINIGAGQDLIIQHNGTNSFIDNNTGDLYIQTTGSGDDILIESADDFTVKVAGSETAIQATGDGAVELYHNNTKTFQTTDFGAEVIFTSGSGNEAIFKVLHSNLSQGIGFGYNTILATGTNTNVDLRLESKGSGLIYAIDTLQAQAGVNVTGNITATGTLDTGNATINRVDVTVVTDGSRNNGVFIEPGDTGQGNRPKLRLKGAGNAGLSADAIQVFYDNGSTKAFEVDYQGNIEARDLDSRHADFSAGIDVTGNITVSGTVDGRDVATDGTKLDGIEASATADQTASEILTLIKTVDGTTSGLDADTLDGVEGASFLRSDANDTASGQITLTSSSQYPLNINASDDGKIVLQGSSSPYIRFREGTSDKAFIQWASAGYFRLRNQEDSSELRIQDDLRFSTDAFGSSNHKVWHEGNDGGGSGLDADTVDSLHASSFLRSDANDTTTGIVNFTSSSQYPININGSDDGKIVLQGSSNPYIRFREGTTDKAYIQFNSNGNLYIVNQESGEQLYVGSGTNGLKYVHNGTTSTVWHAGNDGTGTGLDADTVDGEQASSFVKHNSNTTSGGTAHILRFGSGSDSGHASSSYPYGIFQEGGAWSSPFPDLRINYHTGIIMAVGAQQYGGLRFQRDYNNTTELMSIGDGDNHTRVAYNLNVSGDINANGGAGAVTVAANSDIRFTNGNWTGDAYGKIQHHSNRLYIGGGTDGIYFRENNANRWIIDGGGHYIPAANDTYDIGSSSARVRNIYTQDLQLSNEAKKDKGGNDVDGTWGDWTLQEGEEEIFMINNRTGKKYAMMLREVA